MFIRNSCFISQNIHFDLEVNEKYSSFGFRYNIRIILKLVSNMMSISNLPQT